MQKRGLIENLENIIRELKNAGNENDNIVIWAYDSSYSDEGGCWIAMDGKFELDERNNLNIL